MKVIPTFLFILSPWLLFAFGCSTARTAKWAPKVAIVVTMLNGLPTTDDMRKIQLVAQPEIEKLGFRFVTDRQTADFIVVFEFEPPQFPEVKGELSIIRVLTNPERMTGAVSGATQRDMITSIESAMSRH